MDGLPACGGTFESLTDTTIRRVGTCGPDAVCGENQILPDIAGGSGTRLQSASCSCERPFYNTSDLAAYDAGCLRARHAESVLELTEAVVVQIFRTAAGTARGSTNLTLRLGGSDAAPTAWSIQLPAQDWLTAPLAQDVLPASSEFQVALLPLEIDASRLAERSAPYSALVRVDVNTSERGSFSLPVYVYVQVAAYSLLTPHYTPHYSPLTPN